MKKGRETFTSGWGVLFGKTQEDVDGNRAGIDGDWD